MPESAATTQNENETLSFHGRLTYLLYEADEQRPADPVADMHVYIDIPSDNEFHLFHARTDSQGKLCTAPNPGDPESPPRNNMWLAEEGTYQVYYQPTPDRTISEITADECQSVSLTNEELPSGSRAVLRLARRYDDLELELTGEGDSPWEPPQGQEALVQLLDPEGEVIAEAAPEMAEGTARVRFPHLPNDVTLTVQIPGQNVVTIEPLGSMG